MCGRFTLTMDPYHLQQAFPWAEIPVDLSPRYNIAPSQMVAAIPNTGENKVSMFKWGLIPAWAKDPAIGDRMINARAESLADKPSFRNAYKRRRCLILADGFYEWQQNPAGKGKQPVFIHLNSSKPFAFAGLWEIWKPKEGSEIRSCTIITTEPNSLISQIHNRMPVILNSEFYQRWLSPDELAPDVLDPLLVPYPASEMATFPVSRKVNNPQVDNPGLLNPLEEQSSF